MEAQVGSHQNIVGALKIWKGLFKTRKLPMVELSTQFVELFDVWHMHFFRKAIACSCIHLDLDVLVGLIQF